MEKTANKKVTPRKLLIIYVATVLLLTLAAINIKNYLTQASVLGVQTKQEKTETDSSASFWQNFLAKNPDYIPGWIEIGRVDKASSIDPNYLIR